MMFVNKPTLCVLGLVLQAATNYVAQEYCGIEMAHRNRCIKHIFSFGVLVIVITYCGCKLDALFCGHICPKSDFYALLTHRFLGTAVYCP